MQLRLSPLCARTLAWVILRSPLRARTLPNDTLPRVSARQASIDDYNSRILAWLKLAALVSFATEATTLSSEDIALEQGRV